MSTRYFWLSRDDVIARLKDGWLSQVWQPNSKQWADYPDLDVVGEATEIDATEAQKRGAVLDPAPSHGEFASA